MYKANPKIIEFMLRSVDFKRFKKVTEQKTEYGYRS